MRLVISCAAFVVAIVSPVAADDPSPPSLAEVAVAIEVPGSSDELPGASQIGGDDSEYGLIPACGLGATYICYEAAQCVVDGEQGTSFEVTRNGIRTGTLVCFTEQEAAEQEQVTPGRVLRAFRSLTWPQSELTIQPPGGQTLVNFATNFYTDNDGPTRQRVSLLNQDVLIEATPTTYTWRFGDGSTASTASPGAPYPGLEVTHDYGTVDTFAPTLDTTYTGRYRLNGGPWIAIPETLTVPGAAQSLETVAARPTLVEY